MHLRLKNLFIAFAFAVSAIFFCLLSRGFNDMGTPAVLPAVAPHVPEKAAGSLRIASMNCKNYLSTNRYTADGKYKRRWAKPLAEREAMWQLFAAIRPDIVALQEIGGQTHLYQLAGDLSREVGLEFPYRVCLEARDQSRRIGIISAVPFEAVFRYPETELMSRGLLGVEVATGTHRLRVFTLHLKSKISRSEADPECAAERLAEARCVAERIAESGGALCVLVGDFNDAPESEAVTCLAEEGALKRLDLKDSRGDGWTYRYFKTSEKDTFDHFLISPGLAAFKVAGSGKVTDEALARRMLPDGTSVYASDHRMIFADFFFPQSEN